MKQLKDILCDIVRYTYKDDCKNSYFKFYIELSEKDFKTKHGLYKMKEKRIIIYNTYRDDEAILCTTVHELAHHIDFCNRGTSDHKESFYKVYEELLFTAMNMGIIHKDKFLQTTKDASDSNKIRKIMDKYKPNPISYKQDQTIISFTNCYEYKNYLKNNGYQYNANQKAWEKEVEDIDKELNSLKEMPGVILNIRKVTDIHFNPGKESTALKISGLDKKIVATGNTYSYKENLKEEGFLWDKRTKTWQYHILEESDEKRLRKKYPEIIFKII